MGGVLTFEVAVDMFAGGRFDTGPPPSKGNALWNLKVRIPTGLLFVHTIHYIGTVSTTEQGTKVGAHSVASIRLTPNGSI